MGATRNISKIQVAFAYHLNSLESEWTVAVVANVYHGRYDTSYPRDLQTGQDEEATAEIVAATFHPQGRDRAETWDNIPSRIREDIERAAIEHCAIAREVTHT